MSNQDSFRPSEAWLNELREGQLAFVTQWLQSEDAKQAWLGVADGLVEHALKTPLSDLLDPDGIDDALDAALSPKSIEETILPGLDHALSTLATELSARKEPLSAFTSQEAQQSIDDWLAQPKLISEPVLRAAIQNPAAEGLMHEILYDALRQFSDKVNPFFADWGIPALLDRLPALARGPVKKAFIGMRDEFDRRLEPEMKGFLKGFCRSALTRTADLIVEHDANPDFIRLRQQVAATIRDQPIESLAYAPDEPRGVLGIASLKAVARSILGSQELRQRLGALCHEAFDAHKTVPVGKLLESHGIAPAPTAPFAIVVWPAIRSMLGSDPVREQLGAVIDASHAQIFGAADTP